MLLGGYVCLRNVNLFYHDIWDAGSANNLSDIVIYD